MANFEAANFPLPWRGEARQYHESDFHHRNARKRKDHFRARSRPEARTEFIDLDFCITQRFRASVAEIFRARRGRGFPSA